MSARSVLCKLFGCRKPEPRRVVEFYGDSLTFGSIAGPAGELTRNATPPVRRAQELLGSTAVCVDLSLPGATTQDALDGVAMMPFGRFAEHVQMSGADTLVLRYGGADAVRGVAAVDFERNLTALVVMAKHHQKTVLLVGVIATTTGFTDEFNAAVSRVAFLQGVTFVDVRSVPVTFPDDLADGVHPAQGWSDRLVAVVVRAIQSSAL